MNSKTIVAALSTAALLALASCKDKDYTAHPPTWKGFRIERNGKVVSGREVFAGGDSMRVTAVQDQKGRYINSTYYTWTLTCQVRDTKGGLTDSTLTKQYRTNYDGIDNSDPRHTFAIPQHAEGRATVSFSATYNYSSDGVQVWDGSIVGGNTGYSGTIHSTSALLSGDAKGSFSFNIQ
ncbi:MAG TPA: hypothetical protein DC006_03175 [Prevotellaceae bacterium]|nr:hypothetical protein [Prevotellaceae bacterium]